MIEKNEHPGKKLMETNCYICHNPVTSHDNRLAPPMIAVKKHYKNENTTKKEFIDDFILLLGKDFISDSQLNPDDGVQAVKDKSYFISYLKSKNPTWIFCIFTKLNFSL